MKSDRHTIWTVALLAAVCSFIPSAAVRVQAATLAADYQVQNVYTSSVGTIGPLTAINLGGVGFTDNQNVNGNTQYVLSITAGVNGSAATPSADTSGVQAQTAGFLSSSNYSIVLLASFPLTPSLVATKVFDFKNLSADAGLYINNTTGLLSFNGASTPPPIAGTPAVSGMYTQIVLTRDSATNAVTVYQGGTQAFSFIDTSGLAILGDATMSSNAYLTVFKDDTANIDGGALTSESSEGNIARMRLYDGVLTAGEVAGLDTVVPEPSTWAMLVGGGVVLGVAALRRRTLRC